MMTELRSELAAQPPLPGSYNPRKGELCAAKFSEDGQWYRAKIENTKGRETVDILYVDFGNRETTNASLLAALPPAFHHLPAGAKEYRLAFVQLPPDPADAASAIGYFARQVLGQPQLLLNVEYKAGGLEFATVATVDKVDIGKSLISNGYALVENRRDRRLQSIINEYKEAQELAKKTRLNLWQYGDFTGDEL
jgi:staphylococcal nuclease domain-containing protein 1